VDLLKETFQKIGYGTMEVQCTLHRCSCAHTKQILETKPAGMAVILYMQTVSGKIYRLLAKYNIKTIHQLVKKNS
jgi:hypothetical protein